MNAIPVSISNLALLDCIFLVSVFIWKLVYLSFSPQFLVTWLHSVDDHRRFHCTENGVLIQCQFSTSIRSVCAEADVSAALTFVTGLLSTDGCFSSGRMRTTGTMAHTHKSSRVNETAGVLYILLRLWSVAPGPKGRTQTDCIHKHGARENVWTYREDVSENREKYITRSFIMPPVR